MDNLKIGTARYEASNKVLKAENDKQIKDKRFYNYKTSLKLKSILKPTVLYCNSFNLFEFVVSAKDC